MRRKTLDMLELVVFIIFILSCIALMVGVLFEQGCVSVSQPPQKLSPTILVKEEAVAETQTNLTLHWASLKKERMR